MRRLRRDKLEEKGGWMQGSAGLRRRSLRLLSPWLVALALAFGWSAPARAQFTTDPGLVINTVQTWLWLPPSPDPSGITYRPDTGQLLTCDAEVEEIVSGITHYEGVNVWTHSLTGVVSSTYTTLPYSNEPTGIAFDPAGGRIWITDDVQGAIHQILFGPDGQFGTADDVISDLDDVGNGICDDVEDVTYNPFDGHLYIASGAGQEICELEPGPNGYFNGVPPTGDDLISTVTTAPTIPDPEGIVFDPFSGTAGTLVIADRSTRDLYELTPEGGLLRKIDVNFPSGTKPAGVTIAPGSTNPLLRNYYVVDRKVDNNADPNENDGRLFEVVAVPLGGNGAPIVDAGSPQTLQWPSNSANLSGFVSDDGHPYPPSVVTAVWSKQTGPGSVSFGNATQPVTTASFSAPGAYVLQLVGNDSALNTLDTVAITLEQDVTLSVVTSGPGTVTLDPPGGTYNFGQSVTLTAVPDAGAAFTGWSGALGGVTNPQILVMDADKSVTASFATLVSLDVTTSGPGSVNLSPPGGSYLPGTEVTLSAVPGANAVFSGWGGALAGSTNPELLTVNTNTAVSASFTQLYNVATSAVGPGSVTLAPPTGPYPAGTNLSVTATANADAVFLGWSGDLAGAVSPANLLVDANKSVTGTFATLYDVGVSTTGPGSVTLDPPGGTYAAGTVVSVSATPDVGAIFTGFGGDLGGSVTPQPLTVDADKTVSASFVAQYTLSVSASGPGSVTLDPPGGLYDEGTSVTVTATPDPDSAFTGFSGDLSGTTNPLVVVMSANTSASAGFATLYDVGASATGPGSITLDPPGGTYPAGTVVSVSATPDASAAFIGFGGDLSGTTTPQPLTVDADKTVSASFVAQYTLSALASGPGTVTLDPPGGVYNEGTSVTVTALPDLDSAFLGFSGGRSGTTSPQIVAMSANTSATATFATLFDVAASATGPGTLTLDPPGGTYPAGTVVTVTATPNASAIFTGFGGDLSGTTTPQPLTVDADKTVSASFVAQYTLSASATGPGSITLDPPGGVYNEGTVVTVTATPNASAIFTGFAGDLIGTVTPQLLTLDADKSVSASFVAQYTLSVVASGPGSVTLDPPGGLYDEGTSVTVTATPDLDSVFTGFSGDLSGTTNPLVVVMSANTSATASFATLYDVSASATGPGSVTLDPPGGTYPAGTVVTVSAAPDASAAFTGFGGDLSGTVTPQPLTVDADKTVSASFVAVYTLATSVTGVGHINLDPAGGSYTAGTLVTVTAVSDNAGFTFTGWSGDLSGSVNPTTLLMDGDKTVTAGFQSSAPTACGIGPELVALLPPLGWLFRRRRTRRKPEAPAGALPTAERFASGTDCRLRGTYLGGVDAERRPER